MLHALKNMKMNAQVNCMWNITAQQKSSVFIQSFNSKKRKTPKERVEIIQKKQKNIYSKMSSEAEFADNLFANGEKLSCGRRATQSPWQRHGCDSFQLSSWCNKAAVVCALYCDNRPCWGAKGATLDPRPTHVAREERLFLAPLSVDQNKQKMAQYRYLLRGFHKAVQRKAKPFCVLLSSLCWYWSSCI